MALFSSSLIRDYAVDEALVATRWVSFQKFLSKIDFVHDVKEEKYQDGFLKDIFESCLGYTLDSTDPSSFNLEREKKNETDSKKADGVIYLNGQVVGIIELKDQKTKNLDAIEVQAFNYHNSHANSRYIIISNFDELRFYIDKKTAYEKFSLFNLTYDEFKKLHLLLSYESIRDGLPLSLKEKSANFEAQISKTLYRDFSTFRAHLFENIVKNNYHSVIPYPDTESISASSNEILNQVQDDKNATLDKSTLLRLTQKLCDRIVFILFAEDRGLLSPNTIHEIRTRHSQDIMGNPMYEYYKIYFNSINLGNEKLNISKYNGGLFAKDEMLDSLVIDDKYLDMEAQKLSDYDFMSDISVNILGHIFEQSLTDLEEMERSFETPRHSELDSESIKETLKRVHGEKKVSKRKKDGVFYTPEYITRYIVENTLGKLCTDKKSELDLGSETLVSPNNPKKLTKAEQQYKQNILAYREWLTNLKILDPACGSGAFLNQALEFLIREHTLVRDMLLPFQDLTLGYEIETAILEHNLYGVDINEDAVEIARLSLWLRTAHKGRTLTNLSDKIVCANSLINMPFEENSFDVVIGNPPYVRQEAIKDQKEALSQKYEVYTGTADLYVYFYELAIRLLKPNALTGFICSNKFFRAKYGENLRKYILDNTTIEEIADFNGVKVFEDATVDSAITIFKKAKADKNHEFKVVDTDLENFSTMLQSDLSDTSFTFSNPAELIIKKKIEKVGTPLKEWDININYGIKTGFNEAFIINEAKKDELIKKDSKSAEIIKPLLRGRNLDRYVCDITNEYLINSHNNPPVNINDYSAIKEHLDFYFEKLSARYDKGETPYNLRNCKYLNSFDNPKIIYPEFSSSSQFSFDDKKSYLLDTSWFIDKGDKYLLACLNSKLIWHYLGSISSSLGNASLRMKKIFVEQIPIPKISETEQQPFIELVDEILSSKEKIKKYKKHFDTLNAVDKIEITEETEKLENRVKSNENTIDQMVYKLYGLTDEEIKIVEGNKD
ncbi:MAG: Eco57I restriction-modification methylase domain-containing protein [Sulfurovaceae bacterium]